MFRTARGPVAFAALAALVLGLLLTCGPVIRPAPAAFRAGPAAEVGASAARTGPAAGADASAWTDVPSRSDLPTGADAVVGADASAGVDASGEVAIRTAAGPVGIRTVRSPAVRTEAGTARSSAVRTDLLTKAPAVRSSSFRAPEPAEVRAVGDGMGVPGCDGPGRSGSEGAARPVLPPRAHGFAEVLPALAADRTVPGARHPGADAPPVPPGREPPARVPPSPVELSVLRV
ncbi:hypothetical protein ACIQHY_04325 [Streptomyces sp. NPDC092359]|uniref:hypothetical protein n=1 Tax=Streptomyces sp. NPDC092359 TaxID=3366014 RepID=UPI00382E1D11